MMALFGWFVILVIVAFLTFALAFVTWFGALWGSRSRVDTIILIVAWCIIGFCWYKVYGWFPFSLTPKV